MGSVSATPQNDHCLLDQPCRGERKHEGQRGESVVEPLGSPRPSRRALRRRRRHAPAQERGACVGCRFGAGEPFCLGQLHDVARLVVRHLHHEDEPAHEEDDCEDGARPMPLCRPLRDADRQQARQRYRRASRVSLDLQTRANVPRSTRKEEVGPRLWNHWRRRTGSPRRHRHERGRHERQRRISVGFGALYLVTFVTSIPARDLFQRLSMIPRATSRRRCGQPDLLRRLLELTLIIANIGTAVVVFPLLKRREILSLGYVAARIMECVFILVGIIAILAVVTVASGCRRGCRLARQARRVARRDQDWTFMLGPGFVLGSATA